MINEDALLECQSKKRFLENLDDTWSRPTIDSVSLSKLNKTRVKIEHSENKIITNFETEVGPGVLQFRIQEASPCKKSKQKEQN